MRARVALALASLGLGACHHRVPATDDKGQGQTSYKILNSIEVVPGAPEPSGEAITPVYPNADNETPLYPAAALKAGCGQGSVAVRVHVGVDGKVSAQQEVPGRPVAADECHNAFREAVRVAVGKWTYVPAMRVGPVERTPIGLDLDYEFAFEVIGGKGVVRTR